MQKAPKNSIHFSQGLRGNNLVAHAQKILKQRKLRHWAMLEKINDNGFKGKIRRILYRILCIGESISRVFLLSDMELKNGL